MAHVYILYSKKLNSYYTGSCLDLTDRLKQHQTHLFPGFTNRADDWELFISISHLDYNQARKIEKYIKKMKSKKYIQNLKEFPELLEKLKNI